MNEEKDEGYYQKIDWNDDADIETKVKAMYNIVNFLSREMSIGRVPNNRKELETLLDVTEQKLENPLSIAFVRMVQKGEIDEVSASEHADLFIQWSEYDNFIIGDLRQYKNKLYKCIQAHKGQADWTPDISISLWKECGVNENGIPEFSQPISAGDAYMKGDEVIYNGIHYRSLIDNNVWSPDNYPTGWEVID